MQSAHSLNFRLEKALLIALVAVINGVGVLLRLVVLLIAPDNEGHRLCTRLSFIIHDWATKYAYWQVYKREQFDNYISGDKDSAKSIS